MRRPTAAFIHPQRAGGDGIGWQPVGSTVRRPAHAANALRYGYRSDDYNLQNIAAGTRVQVNMTSSFARAATAVTYNDDGGPGLNARLDFIYQEGYRMS